MITQFNRENLVKNLPDAYRKTDDSNNRKILDIEKSAMDKLREAIRAIDESLDLERATGKTLDLYGEMVGQQRGQATDSQYRMLIKTRIVRNFANGDFNSIVNLLALIFGCDPVEIGLDEPEDKPCTVVLSALPFGALNRMAIDITTACKIVMEVMPAGVHMESLSFTGTFEFGATEFEYDENAGFGNEAQTIGGYLGYIFDDNTPALPV